MLQERRWIVDGYDPRDEIWAELIEENGGFAPNSTEMWSEFWSVWTLRGVPIRDWSEYAAFKSVLNVSTEFWNYHSRTWKRLDSSMAIAFSSSHGGWSSYDHHVLGSASSRFTLSDGYNEQNEALFRIVLGYEHNEIMLGHSVTRIEYADDADYRYQVRYLTYLGV